MLVYKTDMVVFLCLGLNEGGIGNPMPRALGLGSGHGAVLRGNILFFGGVC